MKKLISLVLVFSLCICLLPVSALAGDYAPLPWEAPGGRSFWSPRAATEFAQEYLGEEALAVEVVFGDLARVELKTPYGVTFITVKAEGDLLFRDGSVLISQEILTSLLVGER